jgi:predicted nuclease of restriction endonuclease-like (RecB) superfamily
MNLKALQSVISNVHTVAQQHANVAINQSLTMRNWLIGHYLVEYEQNGSDRQKYGSKVLQLIAEHAIKKNIKGLSQTTLKLCRQFFMHYPSIGQLATDQFKDHAIVLIGKTSPKQLKPSTTKTKISISQLTTDQFKNDDSEIFVEPEILINKLSFTHFVELIRVQNSLQKTFYELQSIKENWSVQDLKRAINTNLYARTGLSKNKTSIIKKLKKDLPLTPEELIKNPYSLEFLGLSEKKEFTENDLESAIINHLQQFISEMGKGFCFEARQKRITIGNKHYYIDLVFYHRILKCHVLIDLKMDAQMHEAAGQINYYLNYYNKNERQKSDNPPIGIILSANEDDAEVEYALGNLNNKIFITKYKIALPSERVLKNFIKKDLQKFYQAFRK